MCGVYVCIYMRANVSMCVSVDVTVGWKSAFFRGVESIRAQSCYDGSAVHHSIHV